MYIAIALGVGIVLSVTLYNYNESQKLKKVYDLVDANAEQAEKMFTDGTFTNRTHFVNIYRQQFIRIAVENSKVLDVTNLHKHLGAREDQLIAKASALEQYRETEVVSDAVVLKSLDERQLGLLNGLSRYPEAKSDEKLINEIIDTIFEVSDEMWAKRYENTAVKEKVSKMFVALGVKDLRLEKQKNMYSHEYVRMKTQQEKIGEVLDFYAEKAEKMFAAGEFTNRTAFVKMYRGAFIQIALENSKVMNVTELHKHLGAREDQLVAKASALVQEVQEVQNMNNSTILRIVGYLDTQQKEMTGLFAKYPEAKGDEKLINEMIDYFFEVSDQLWATRYESPPVMDKLRQIFTTFGVNDLRLAKQKNMYSSEYVPLTTLSTGYSMSTGRSLSI